MEQQIQSTGEAIRLLEERVRSLNIALRDMIRVATDPTFGDDKELRSLMIERAKHISGWTNQ